MGLMEGPSPHAALWAGGGHILSPNPKVLLHGVRVPHILFTSMGIPSAGSYSSARSTGGYSHPAAPSAQRIPFSSSQLQVIPGDRKSVV